MYRLKVSSLGCLLITHIPHRVPEFRSKFMTSQNHNFCHVLRDFSHAHVSPESFFSFACLFSKIFQVFHSEVIFVIIFK